MENQTVTVAATDAVQKPALTPEQVKKAIKKRIKYQYTLSSLAILFQILIVNTVATVLLIGIAVIIMAVQMASSGSLPDFQDVFNMLNKTWTMPITGVSYVFGNLISAFLCVKFSKCGRLRDWFNKPVKFSALDVIMGGLALLGIGNLTSTITSFCGSFFSNTAENIGNTFGSGLFADNKVAVVITVLYVAILGPITEEILCRGAILNISSVVSRRFAIVASAVLFGIMHGNIIQAINASILGLVLGYAAEKTKSLIVPCILHIINNSTAVILMFAFEGLSEEAATRANWIITITFIVLGAISLFFLLKKHGKITEDDAMKTNTIISKQDIEFINEKPSKITVIPFVTTFTFIISMIFLIGMTISTGLIA